jgi:restriction system protein
MTSWRAYQEEVAAFFRTIGLDADTNETLTGVRTKHDIDVVVRSQHVGFDLLWIVECKKWKTRVTKLHVLGLRTIVADLGADRGLIMAEKGFQGGAHDAALLTNVQVTSLAELKNAAGHAVGMAQLRALQERVENCRQTYWKYAKDVRIAHGLRPDPGVFGYSATTVMDGVEALVFQGLLGRFPPTPSDPRGALAAAELKSAASTPTQLFADLEPEIAEVERRLAAMSARAHPK